jgi:hypothetical protein
MRLDQGEKAPGPLPIGLAVQPLEFRRRLAADRQLCRDRVGAVEACGPGDDAVEQRAPALHVAAPERPQQRGVMLSAELANQRS